jgi:hypothetical protein
MTHCDFIVFSAVAHLKIFSNFGKLPTPNLGKLSEIPENFLSIRTFQNSQQFDLQ